MTKCFILFAVLLISCSCSFFFNEEPTLPMPQTVPHVDLVKYSGLWYQQASLPFFWEIGCKNSAARYSLNEDGSIKIENSCERLGHRTSTDGKAVPEDETNSKLKVSFFETFGVEGQYWIVRLAEDYSYAVVSDPYYKNLWILARCPNLDEKLYKSIVASLTADGYPTDKLIRTPFSGKPLEVNEVNESH